MLSVSGMRGTFGGSLTPDVVTRYCGAFAAWVHQQRATIKSAKRPHVVVGYDGRAGSDAVATLVGAALEMNGCDVTALPLPQMTPTIGFIVDRLGADAGLQVTASHNPQEWCGLKPIVRAAGARKGEVSASAPGKALADEIIGRYNAGTGAFAQWGALGQPLSDSPRVTEEHPLHVARLIKQLGVAPAIKKARLHAALDSVTSSGFVAGHDLLSTLGVKVSGVNPDKTLAAGLFPHTPEPTRDNLVGLSRFVKKAKGKIHVGFAQDPDGDRLAVVDETGSYIGEEYTLVLASMAMGELGQLKKGQVLAVNLSTSRMIEDVAGWYGCHVVRTAVGEANVVEGMRANKSPIGGEGNGGVIWPKVTYIRDSLGAMALILALMARRKQKVSELVAQVPSYAIVKRKIDLNPAMNPKDVVAALADKYAQHKPDRTDGVWVNFADQRAWLHVRASNTEPIMRLIAEAPTAEQAGAILDEAASVV
jgi:phosphomannomutase